MPLQPRIPRPSPIRSKAKAQAKKDRTSAEHMANVRATMLCAATEQDGPVDVHHLMRGVTRGMGLRAAGKHTVPLSHSVHMDATGTGDPEGYLMERYGLDCRALADALWQHRDEPGTFRDIVRRHYLRARERMQGNG